MLRRNDTRLLTYLVPNLISEFIDWEMSISHTLSRMRTRNSELAYFLAADFKDTR